MTYSAKPRNTTIMSMIRVKLLIVLGVTMVMNK